MYNIAQGIIFFLEHRSGLEIPEYNLKLIDGNKPGEFNLETRDLLIPKWIFETDHNYRVDPEYCIYYLAHELAHVCVDEQTDSAHGLLFYYYFKKLCPPELQPWELDYLPEKESYLNV